MDLETKQLLARAGKATTPGTKEFHQQSPIIKAMATHIRKLSKEIKSLRSEVIKGPHTKDSNADG